MHGTIDLHCHLLPGIDDGARDLEDAVAMARHAEADGVVAICATPHIRADHAVVIGELPARRDELAAALTAAGCRTRVLPGGEVAATMLDGMDDDELAAVALGGSKRWILLEPPPGPLGEPLQDGVDALHARGFRALIAHPERHPGPQLIERLGALVARGALVQATAAFFTDQQVKADMLALARLGLIHLLGSDSHSSRAGRPVELAAALEVLCGVDPVRGHLGWVAHTAPRAIIHGQDPTPPFTPPVSSVRAWRAGA